jgi:acyl-CoA synthetase (AMP-forming)/AMP-acid ligase II
MFPGIQEVCVYGIKVPGGFYDGQAGACAIVVDGTFDIQGLYSFVKEKLAGYAVPRFIRIVKSITVTGMFCYFNSRNV